MKSLLDCLLRYRHRGINPQNRQIISHGRHGRHRRIALERLEERLTPSGETVTATFTAVPVQRTVVEPSGEGSIC